MFTRRFVLTGMIAAPAVIAADRLMPVRTIVQRYATVYGVGHDLEVVEWIAWDVNDALRFATTRGGIDQFREVTDVVYGFDMPPLPPAPAGHWSYTIDPFNAMKRNVEVMENGFTTVSGYSKINEWRESLRPDLGGQFSKEWIDEMLAEERKFGITSLGQVLSWESL